MRKFTGIDFMTGRTAGHVCYVLTVLWRLLKTHGEFFKFGDIIHKSELLGVGGY